MELLSAQAAGEIVIPFLIVCLALGVHIGVALGLAGFIGILLTVGPDAAGAQFAAIPFSTTNNFNLAVIPLKGKQGAAAIICTDGTFTVAPPMAAEPYELGETLIAGRSLLEVTHAHAYQEYDRLAKNDKDALRQARLEKIIGAIENNLEQIPELKERLKALVKEWP